MISGNVAIHVRFVLNRDLVIALFAHDGLSDSLAFAIFSALSRYLGFIYGNLVVSALAIDNSFNGAAGYIYSIVTVYATVFTVWLILGIAVYAFLNRTIGYIYIVVTSTAPNFTFYGRICNIYLIIAVLPMLFDRFRMLVSVYALIRRSVMLIASG